MNKSAIISGLAGAVVLTIVHEVVKKQDAKAPRMDLLGMMALSKIWRSAGKTPPPEKKLYLYTMLGDLVSNALYYSLAGVGKQKRVLQKEIALGLAAGLGALVLPKPLHLNKAYSNRTAKTQVMTVAYYVIGGLVAAALMKRLQKKP